MYNLKMKFINNSIYKSFKKNQILRNTFFKKEYKIYNLKSTKHCLKKLKKSYIKGKYFISMDCKT